MSRLRRLRVLALLVAAAVTLLAFAATASAETLAGETNAGSISSVGADPGATFVKGTATYESSGKLTFVLTTAAPSDAVATFVVVGQTSKECNALSLLGGGGSELLPPPFVEIVTTSEETTTAVGKVVRTAEEEGGELPASKSISGTTMTLSMASPRASDLTPNCAIAITESETVSTMAFPLSVPPPPVVPAPPALPAAPAPPAPPAPSPAALAISRLKTARIKVGQWKTVKVEVTNTGGTTMAAGSLRVKPVKGVNVKPESQMLPALAPGQSWTLPVRVELTKKAKPKSTLTITATGASATSATGSLVARFER